jgi:pimeloyl-ACP methyl ester carboxylesterase
MAEAIVAAMPTAQLGDQLVHWHQAPGPLEESALYVHGVPNSGSMWRPFLEQTGGVAVDLPGFGRSGKRGDLDTSFEALGRFVGDFADHLGLERVRLCAHDWGAVALLWAMREPERVERLVVIDGVPFLPGYRWHFVARQWRRRVLGELAMGAAVGPLVRRLVPRAVNEDVLEHLDVGTQRSILRLYRSAPEEALERAGSGLGRIACPSLVVWGERDPFIPASFAQAYAVALGGSATATTVPGAGHWPWVDAPEVVPEVTRFLVR